MKYFKMFVISLIRCLALTFVLVFVLPVNSDALDLKGLYSSAHLGLIIVILADFLLSVLIDRKFKFKKRRRR